MRRALVLALVLVAAPAWAQQTVLPGDTTWALQWSQPCTETAVYRAPSIYDDALGLHGDRCGATKIASVRRLSDGWAFESSLPHCFVVRVDRAGARWVCGVRWTAAPPATYFVDGSPAIVLQPAEAHVEVWTAPSCWVIGTRAECRRSP